MGSVNNISPVYYESFERTLENKGDHMSQGAVSIDETESALDAIELMTQKESGASVFATLQGRSGSLLT